MSEFKKANEELQKLADSLNQLLADNATQPVSAVGTLSELEIIHSRLVVDMGEIADKLKARASEKDPDTGKPRYGPKMLEKVETFLSQHAAVAEKASSHLEPMRMQVNQELELEAERRQQQERGEKEAELQKMQELEKEREAEVLKENAKRIRQQEEEERKAIAEEAEKRRMERQLLKEAEKRKAMEEATAAFQAEVEKQQREAELSQSLRPGLEGVRDSLKILRENTTDAEYKRAVTTLHVLVNNVVSRPENDVFRLIKRSNPHFQRDVSAYLGGTHVLQAVGFKSQEREGQPVLFLEEPDLASDIDRWSQWFEDLKSADELLKESIPKR